RPAHRKHLAADAAAQSHGAQRYFQGGGSRAHPALQRSDRGGRRLSARILNGAEIPEELTITADLHCHSTLSDGVLPPEEVARRAHANGVTLWALTAQARKSVVEGK